ncbi:GAF domain-containing protein [Chitinophagaceae bacterium LB-8]|uniref:GAF domain-containing protein n=1 Tax=Paraflavisolibacter caeni TaxID=2982496 RepID=A0A9X2XZU9_9BACT|nr:GAF domain-containing protein [Paraflavisolibacter caeni]MCU7551762.1 GAF domain-containing protein [Paraflavisolibacter caeni]
MQCAPRPLNEEIRLLDLKSYNILDSAPEKEFEELLELAGQVCDCPISLITFIDADRQWFKAIRGTELMQTSRDASFCTHTILQQDIMVIPDTLQDDRFFDHPHVVEGMKIRFYAGVPITSAAGYNLGSVCIIDQKPRTLTPLQARTLTIIAHQVTKLLELRVKNDLIRRQAEEMLLKQKQVLLKNLTAQEKERQSIGRELHENIAQTLASTQLYLDMAENVEEMRLPLLRKAKAQQIKLLDDIRHLSQTITPTTLESTDLQSMIEFFIQGMRYQVPFNIHVTFSGDTEKIESDRALALFRIVEQQLTMLRQRTDVQNVHIELHVWEEVSLMIRDDGNGINNERDEKMSANLIENRAELLNGSVQLKTSQQGSTLIALIPLVNEPALN